MSFLKFGYLFFFNYRFLHFFPTVSTHPPLFPVLILLIAKQSRQIKTKSNLFFNLHIPSAFKSLCSAVVSVFCGMIALMRSVF